MPKQNVKLMLLVFAFVVGSLWIASKEDDGSDGPSTPHRQAAQTSSSNALSPSVQPRMVPTSPYALSPGAQQTAQRVLAAFPAQIQPLWLHSLRALGPRAELYLAMQDSKSNDALAIEVQHHLSIMQTLPADYWQKYMDGLVGVNSEGTSFVAQLMGQNIQGAVDTGRMIGSAINETKIQGRLYECSLDDNCVAVHEYIGH